MNWIKSLKIISEKNVYKQLLAVVQNKFRVIVMDVVGEQLIKWMPHGMHAKAN